MAGGFWAVGYWPDHTEGGGTPITGVDMCNVYGYVKKDDAFLEGAVISMIPSQPVSIYNDETEEILSYFEQTSDSEGYWEQELPETTNMDVTYTFVIHYVDSNGLVYHREYSNLVIPNISEKNFAEMIE